MTTSAAGDCDLEPAPEEAGKKAAIIKMTIAQCEACKLQRRQSGVHD
jgi:hypothetical protein